jgi:hypothetical protein
MDPSFQVGIALLPKWNAISVTFTGYFKNRKENK